MENNWISVKDRLPTDTKLVLVNVQPPPEKVKCRCHCHKDKNVKHIQPCCESGFVNLPVMAYQNIDYYRPDNSLGGAGWNISNNVTHWMPLPEPPKQ